MKKSSLQGNSEKMSFPAERNEYFTREKKGVRMKFFLKITAVFFLSLPAALDAQVYVNPLLGNINIHDPSGIIKEGNTYYVFYTGNLIPHKTSPDRMTWTEAGSSIASPGWLSTYVPE